MVVQESCVDHHLIASRLDAIRHHGTFGQAEKQSGLPAVMGKQLKLALVQFASLPPSTSSDSNLTDNLSRALSFILQAAQQGADIVVFPEFFLSGVIADRQHWGLAQPRSRRSQDQDEESVLSQLREKAVECGIDVVAGSIIEHDYGDGDVDGGAQEGNVRQQDRKLFNTSHYICGSTGRILHSYTKKRLWHPEKEYLTPGPASESHTVFETRHGIRCAMLLCWDLAWPEAFRELLPQQVDLIFLPSCWFATDATPAGLRWNPSSEQTLLDSMVVSRAFENECGVAFVNCATPARASSPAPGRDDEEVVAVGRTGLAVPFKGWVNQAAGAAEEMVLATLDLDILADSRSVYRISEDLRTTSSSGLPQ